ncbi:MAG: hypothetical protein HY828_17315 [Actinobacteria bacterium]|nr:hypothetical protein [Actinomycetota bacterium]
MSVTPSPTPVRSAADAISLLSLAVVDPLEAETLAFLLDDEGIGGVIVVFDGTTSADSVLDIVDIMVRTGAQAPACTSLVVASVRPNSGVLPGDVDRWLEASSIASLHGLELLEWYVISPFGIECPRDLLGEPERWAE